VILGVRVTDSAVETRRRSLQPKVSGRVDRVVVESNFALAGTNRGELFADARQPRVDGI
jgi:hypothetical protein